MTTGQHEIEQACATLLAELQGMVTWKWDTHFQALLAEVPSAEQGRILAILEQHHDQQWDVESIGKAPAAIKAKAGFFGELRPNQLLFTSSPAGHSFVLAAWWPWGDGKIISVRLCAPAVDAATDQPQGLFKRIGNLWKALRGEG